MSTTPPQPCGTPGVTLMLARAPLPYHRADAEEWLQRCDTQRAAEAGVNFVMEHEDRLIGVLGINGFGSAGSVPPNLGYWLATSAWGQGFATEGARALITTVFAETPTISIRSGAFVDSSFTARPREARVRCNRQA